MSYALVIKEEATQEAIQSYVWYEEKMNGLGEAFLDELDKCYSKILRNPLTFRKHYKLFRQAHLTRFPFVVIFEVEEKHIVVYSIFHTSRNPAKKFRK